MSFCFFLQQKKEVDFFGSRVLVVFRIRGISLCWLFLELLLWLFCWWLLEDFLLSLSIITVTIVRLGAIVIIIFGVGWGALFYFLLKCD